MRSILRLAVVITLLAGAIQPAAAYHDVFEDDLEAVYYEDGLAAPSAIAVRFRVPDGGASVALSVGTSTEAADVVVNMIHRITDDGVLSAGFFCAGPDTALTIQTEPTGTLVRENTTGSTGGYCGFGWEDHFDGGEHLAVLHGLLIGGPGGVEITVESDDDRVAVVGRSAGGSFAYEDVDFAGGTNVTAVSPTATARAISGAGVEEQTEMLHVSTFVDFGVHSRLRVEGPEGTTTHGSHPQRIFTSGPPGAYRFFVDEAVGAGRFERIFVVGADYSIPPSGETLPFEPPHEGSFVLPDAPVALEIEKDSSAWVAQRFTVPEPGADMWLFDFLSSNDADLAAHAYWLFRDGALVVRALETEGSGSEQLRVSWAAPGITFEREEQSARNSGGGSGTGLFRTWEPGEYLLVYAYATNRVADQGVFEMDGEFLILTDAPVSFGPRTSGTDVAQYRQFDFEGGLFASARGYGAQTTVAHDASLGVHTDGEMFAWFAGRARVASLSYTGPEGTSSEGRSIDITRGPAGGYRFNIDRAVGDGEIVLLTAGVSVPTG